MATQNTTRTALTGRYAKLRDDLIDALEAGRIAEADERRKKGDWGTCNFDSPALHLPRWRRDLVEQAAEEAGTRCMDWSCYGTKLWTFSPDTYCQGIPRTLNAEAMTKLLEARGYSASTYYQMD